MGIDPALVQINCFWVVSWIDGEELLVRSLALGRAPYHLLFNDHEARGEQGDDVAVQWNKVYTGYGARGGTTKKIDTLSDRHYIHRENQSAEAAAINTVCKPRRRAGGFFVS